MVSYNRSDRVKSVSLMDGTQSVWRIEMWKQMYDNCNVCFGSGGVVLLRGQFFQFYLEAG